jgi:metal-dependent amidase/aminoacylase/carboxypeptidase family protein
MIDDGLFTRSPKPDVVLGLHVMVGPAGTIAGSAGPITSAVDSLQIRLFWLDRYPLNVTDKQASDRVAEALRRHFPSDRVRHTGPAPASEDFGGFGSEWNAPSVYWFVGGTDPDIYATAKAAGRINDLPVNHSPLFAPVIHPTLQTGIEAMVAGALAWLAK